MVVEDVASIDMSALARDGVLAPGNHTWYWHEGGVPLSLWVSETPSAMVIASESHRAEVEITTTQPHYGGCRRWFRCPPPCGRRVGRLYFLDGSWRCRSCSGLKYESQRQQAGRRAAEKAKRVRQRLGGEPNLLAPFPPRPRGMHHTTYRLLRAEGKFAEWRWVLSVAAKTERFQ